jgi:hypothetical protein
MYSVCCTLQKTIKRDTNTTDGQVYRAVGFPSYCLEIPLRFYWVFIGYRTIDLESDPYHCFLGFSSYHMTPLTNINLSTCSSDYWTGGFLSFEAELQL